MNATIMSSNDNVTLKPTTNVIAIELDAEVQKRACGLTTWWSCNGDVTIEALTAALAAHGSKATPPEAPSALVALNRAVAATAKVLGHLDVHHKGRGEWAIVSEPTEVVDPATGAKSLSYPIACTAKVEKGQDGAADVLTVEGQGADQIRAAYALAKTLLAPADIGNWLCDKLKALGGIALRDRGGVYFVARGEPTRKWTALINSLKACSRHKVGILYSMKSADAVEAILDALTADTTSVCQGIDEEILTGKMGDKALKNREEQAADLVRRIELYETLLGMKLEALRNAVDATTKAVATARLTLASSDE